MLYIYMLGYDVDFGHMEAVSLISAPKYPEKQVIYVLHDCCSKVLSTYLTLVLPSGWTDIVLVY